MYTDIPNSTFPTLVFTLLFLLFHGDATITHLVTEARNPSMFFECPLSGSICWTSPNSCLFHSACNLTTEFSPLFWIPLGQALFVSHVIIELVFLVPIFPLLTPVLSPHQHFSNWRGHRFSKTLSQLLKAQSPYKKLCSKKLHIFLQVIMCG